jgi:hypothetical protein
LTLNAKAWLAWLEKLPADFGRHAISADPARRAAAAAFMEQQSLEFKSEQLYPWGLEAAHRLWEPWDAARQSVEALALEEPGAQVDYLVHDPESKSLVIGLFGPLSSGCPRFMAHGCPRLIPMGHENARSECNYWAWPGMAQAAPGVELFPEWQRFDCHKYYNLFQAHLCGEALAQALGAEPRWVWHGTLDKEKALRAYAALTSRPDAFEFVPLV